MLSRSCFNLLNLDDYSSDRTRIPRVISMPGVISEFEDGNNVGSQESDTSSSLSQERRIIVANQLPLKGYCRDSSDGKKWCFDWDKDALVLQLRDGFPQMSRLSMWGVWGWKWIHWTKKR
ncbi:UNVERIFIED_CONTAM: putative alpha,alpha-trehalose-phosphate synthase [UDP-forming] 9 [Sesamum calycinum]|uniref:Alpha,alpha-trehalose-phosphate synthase [UDP-forming] 9 n=1 Tax=Sesamum calycinum TaxID=2727403 RepID=A0AAW2RSI5_9LAMI